MTNFIQTGRYTEGCIIPVTADDESLTAMIDEYSEEFRINFFIGTTYIDSIDKTINIKNIHIDILKLVVVNNRNEDVGQVYQLVEESMFYDYFKIHC